MFRLRSRFHVGGKVAEYRKNRGFVSLVVLSVMLVMTIFFYASYQIVVFDYEVVSKSADLRNDRLQQSNVSELVKSFYEEDMLNDISEDRVAFDTGIKSETRDLFKDELRNYTFTYVEDEATGRIDRVEWFRFRNYDSNVSDEGESRKYLIKDNWTATDSDVYDPDRKSLLLPDRVYVRVKFDPGVFRSNLVVGSDYESKTFDLVNRGEDLILPLDSLPRSVEYFQIESDGMLGSTSIELMNSREVDVYVREKDLFNTKDVEKIGVLKTIKISLGKWSLDVEDVDISE